MLKKSLVAGHVGSGGRFLREIVIRFHEGDDQGVLVDGPYTQIRDGAFPTVDLFGVLNAIQLLCQSGTCLGQDGPLHTEDEILRGYGGRTFPQIVVASGRLDAPTGFPQGEGVGPPVLGDRPGRGGGLGLAVFIQAGEALKQGRRHRDRRAVGGDLRIELAGIAVQQKPEGFSFRCFFAAASHTRKYEQTGEHQASRPAERPAETDRIPWHFGKSSLLLESATISVYPVRPGKTIDKIRLSC